MLLNSQVSTAISWLLECFPLSSERKRLHPSFGPLHPDRFARHEAFSLQYLDLHARAVGIKADPKNTAILLSRCLDFQSLPCIGYICC
jgi:hypothetical protein